jgi:hypothetical protein
MSKRLSPEDVVLQMSYDDICELLSDLNMDSTLYSAIRLKRLVRERGRFELAIESLCGPVSIQVPASIQMPLGNASASGKSKRKAA